MVKEGKHAWRVAAKAGEEVTVTYRYYAGVLDAGSSFLDDGESYWNGSNLFMLVEGLREEEHRLVVAAPEEWPVEIQLRRDDDGSFVARDYDHLIDSPGIAAERLTRHSFTEDDARFHLVFRGSEGFDTASYVAPVQQIAREQGKLFGGFPFDEYRFLYHVADRWHGVEHEDSCSIVIRRDGLRDEGVEHLLSISSHELFHAWMVKRMLPARFLPYDYWQETPTGLLWVMEGTTSYYGDLTLVRSGVWSVDQYLAHLQRGIEVLESAPARLHVPLSQASFDAWLATPAHMHDYPNAAISFYNKGELVSALLDLTIRHVSEGVKSLDDVMLLLWNEYGITKRGMEEDAMERAVAQIAGVGDFFARYVDGTDPLPYADLFAHAGLDIGVALRDPDHAGLGVKVKTQDGRLVVESVIRGGAAMEAGILPNDELIAVAGTRTTEESVLGSVLKALPVGEPAELLIARGGQVRRHVMTARPDPRVAVTLRTTGPSDLRRAWLRRDE